MKEASPLQIAADTYTLILHIKEMTNDSQLYNTGILLPCSVMTLVGRKSKQEEIYVYICMHSKSPCRVRLYATP